MDKYSWTPVIDIMPDHVIPPDIFKRVGIFHITALILKNRPDFMMQVMSYVIPFSVDTVENGDYEYICYSPLFDVVDGGIQTFPHYKFGEVKIVNKDTKEEGLLLCMTKLKTAGNIITLNERSKV